MTHSCKARPFKHYFLHTILLKLSETKNLCSLPLGAAERSMVLASQKLRCACFGGNKGGPELSDTRAPPKACAVREVWRKPNLQPGSPFFAYFLAVGALRVSETKKVSGRAAMKRKVKR